jgi:hypothetical protein
MQINNCSSTMKSSTAQEEVSQICINTPAIQKLFTKIKSVFIQKKRLVTKLRFDQIQKPRVQRSLKELTFLEYVHFLLLCKHLIIYKRIGNTERSRALVSTPTQQKALLGPRRQKHFRFILRGEGPAWAALRGSASSHNISHHRMKRILFYFEMVRAETINLNTGDQIWTLKM